MAGIYDLYNKANNGVGAQNIYFLILLRPRVISNKPFKMVTTPMVPTPRPIVVRILSPVPSFK